VAIRWDIWKPETQRRTSIAGQQNAKLRIYKQLIQMRKDEAALTAGDLTWVNNSNLDGVVSFIRKKGNDEILVLINLTNRITKVQVDVPAASYAQAHDLLKNRTVPASLTPDKFSCQLGAFDYLVAARGNNDAVHNKCSRLRAIPVAGGQWRGAAGHPVQRQELWRGW
jgi:hypothetical protein